MIWLRVPGNDWDSSTPNFQEPFQTGSAFSQRAGSQIISVQLGDPFMEEFGELLSDTAQGLCCSLALPRVEMV
jgi:hypothetical protein